MLILLLFVSCLQENNQNKDELYSPAEARGKDELIAFWSVFDDSIHLQNKKYLWGFINAAGDTIIKPMYFYAHDFHDGVALVQIEPFHNEPFDFEDGLVAVWDKEKKIVVSPKYDFRDEHPVFNSAGTAMVKKGRIVM